MTPPTLREREHRAPHHREHNVSNTVTPAMDELFSYYPVVFQAGALRLVTTSVWAHPWWTSTDQSEDIGGAFSDDFSDDFRN